MSRLKKRIIIIGSACLLAVIGIGTYLLLKNNAGKKDREIPAIGEVDEMAEEIADLTEEDNGMIPDEQLCEADITEPDKMTLLSITPVGERISIGSYGSEELGWIVYDEDEEYLYLISEKVIDARPMIDNTASLYELAESSAEYNGKFTDTDLCKWLNDEFINSVFSEEVIEKMQQWSDGIKVTLPDDEFVTEFGDYLWAGPTQTAIENGAEVFNPEPYIEAAGEVRDPMTGELIPEDEIVNHPGLVYPAEADGSASYALGNDITDGNVSIRSFGFTRRNAGIYEKVGVRPMIKVLK
ncbi:MAG: hypothetical protein IJ691_05465 [Lachnospiraceae bacterium]|nr:hypothetical protein [Lachnospiraceae bacterium]